MNSIGLGMSVGVGNQLDARKGKDRRSIGSGMHQLRCKGVRGFGSVLLRRELTRDGARGFGSGIGCSRMILMTRE